MTTFTIVDAIMGAGKTNYAHRLMEQEKSDYLKGLLDGATRTWGSAPGSTATGAEGARVAPATEPQFIYITPFLSEVDRTIKNCPLCQFKAPDSVDGRKLNGFHDQIVNKRNIVSTHSLYGKITKATYGLLRERNYTLVIDEAIGCIEEYDIDDDVISLLFDKQLVEVEPDTKRLRWSYRCEGQREYKGRDLSEIKNLCDNGYLVWMNNKVLIWELPIEFLTLFNRVIVLTYMFEGSILAHYLKANGVAYETKTVVNDQLVAVEQRDDRALFKKLRSLITICGTEDMNSIGQPKRTRGRSTNPLSKSWYDRQASNGSAALDKLKASAGRFFDRFGDHADDDPLEALVLFPEELNNFEAERLLDLTNMWTTFKNHQGRVSGKGMRSKGAFVPLNMRGSNLYRRRKNLAYLANRFMPLTVKSYLQEKGLPVNEDLFALSELVQWVWRSRIRRMLPIRIYIPSQRMRTLFTDWLDGRIDVDRPETGDLVFADAAE